MVSNSLTKRLLSLILVHPLEGAGGGGVMSSQSLVRNSNIHPPLFPAANRLCRQTHSSTLSRKHPR